MKLAVVDVGAAVKIFRTEKNLIPLAFRKVSEIREFPQYLSF